MQWGGTTRKEKQQPSWKNYVFSIILHIQLLKTYTGMNMFSWLVLCDKNIYFEFLTNTNVYVKLVIYL